MKGMKTLGRIENGTLMLPRHPGGAVVRKFAGNVLIAKAKGKRAVDAPANCCAAVVA